MSVKHDLLAGIVEEAAGLGWDLAKARVSKESAIARAREGVLELLLASDLPRVSGGGSIRHRTTKAGAPRWVVLFRADGKQRSRTFSRREAAEAFAAERRIGGGSD